MSLSTALRSVFKDFLLARSFVSKRDFREVDFFRFRRTLFLGSGDSSSSIEISSTRARFRGTDTSNSIAGNKVNEGNRSLVI